MQIVIDIPDYDYRQIKEYYEKNDTVEAIYSYIYHGTPLPKGHGRLIDADELTMKLKAWDININGIPNYAWKRIRETLTIIEADKQDYENDDYYKGAQEEC